MRTCEDRAPVRDSLYPEVPLQGLEVLPRSPNLLEEDLEDPEEDEEEEEEEGEEVMADLSWDLGDLAEVEAVEAINPVEPDVPVEPNLLDILQYPRPRRSRVFLHRE